MLKRITAINADDLEAQAALTDRLVRDGSTDEAITALENLIHIDPYDARSHETLAQRYEQREQWRLAARERFSVLHLNPADRAGAHYELARTLLHADELQAAHGHILSALEVAPLFDDGLELLLSVRDKLDAQEDK